MIGVDPKDQSDQINNPSEPPLRNFQLSYSITPASYFSPASSVHSTTKTMSDQTPSPPQLPETPIPLVAQDPSTWDDTALLQAYARAVQSHRLAGSTPPPTSTNPTPKRRRTQPSPSPITTNTPIPTPHTSKKRQRTASSPSSPHLLFPPPPPLRDATPELEALLLSWYEAGYRAGAFLASQQRQ